MVLDCQDADVSLFNIHVVVHAVVRTKEDPAVNGRKGRLIVGVVFFAKIRMLG